jgi:predicted DNA-binding transcriptional regulator AlpA
MEDKMLNIRQVRDKLGLSYAEVIRLVQSGRLRAYRYAGSGPLSRSEIQWDTKALRFRNSDIEQMLEESLIN